MADQTDADEEAARLEELRRIKRATLHELDKQAAQYTNANVPPHIQTERQRLRRELGMVESVIASPLGASIGDELGEANRFVAYIELMRQGDKATLEAVARLEERFADGMSRFGEALHALAERLQAVDQRSEDRHDQSERNSMLWRRWGTIALIIVIVVVTIIIVVGAYRLGRLDADQSLIGDFIALAGGRAMLEDILLFIFWYGVYGPLVWLFGCTRARRRP